MQDTIKLMFNKIHMHRCYGIVNKKSNCKHKHIIKGSSKKKSKNVFVWQEKYMTVNGTN